LQIQEVMRSFAVEKKPPPDLPEGRRKSLTPNPSPKGEGSRMNS
jgi:hypothetical protein